jgi:lipopolysaccharide transport system permease protein
MSKLAVQEISPPPSRAPEAPQDNEPGAFETIIQPTRGWIGINWAEMFHSRELLYFFIWRDLKVRYKQAILGVGWVVVQPIMNMIMFTVVFGSAAGLNSRLGKGHEHEYSVYVYAALLPWQLFAAALNNGGMSLVSQQHILKKIYLPRLFVPTAAVGGAVIDLLVSFCILFILAAFKGMWLSPWALLLPVLLGLSLLNALGVAYLLSALTVRYRDFRFLIPFLSQLLMFVSFVAFPPSLMGNSKWKWLLLFNPMYGVIATWRKCLLGFNDSLTGFSIRYLVASIVGGLILFVIGLIVFRRTERTFVDIA